MLYQIVDDVGVMEELLFSPFFVFVVPCGTYLNYDEDIDILLELCFSLSIIIIFFNCNSYILCL